MDYPVQRSGPGKPMFLRMLQETARYTVIAYLTV